MSSVLVIAHDAGGAEVVSAWVREHPENNYSFALAGPAIRVFERKLGPLAIVAADDISRRVPAASWVLTGTSWGSDVEKNAIRCAQQQKVRVVSYLDHWTDYAARFQINGETWLPDEIWTGDQYAYQLAADTFPGREVRLVPNGYFQEMREEVARAAVPKPADEKTRILYVTEPTSAAATKKFGNPRQFGYTEFEALDAYLSYLTVQAATVSRVRVRRHPSEAAGKYSEIIELRSKWFPIEESNGTTLVEDCAWSDVIVGCDSMAMVVGVLAGKRVYCSIPKGGKRSAIPFPEIIQLFAD